MSRVLFLRVSACTYDEAEVPKNWPLLYMSVWPDRELAGVASPAKLARELVPARERGVLELADAFAQYARFGDAPAAGAPGLMSGVDRLERLRAELDEALGNRDVAEAQRLCDSLESCLDDLEQLLRDAAML